MTKEQKHTAHLRKKRTQRRDKERDEGELVKRAAKGDKKALRIVEERKASRTLQGSKNVSFIRNSKKDHKQK